MAKYTEAKARANKKWDEKNKERNILVKDQQLKVLF